MTRVVSTKLSNIEHDALLEMTSFRGQTISEFVRESVMLGLCGSWKSNIPDELISKIEELLDRNYKRFRVEHFLLDEP